MLGTLVLLATLSLDRVPHPDRTTLALTCRIVAVEDAASLVVVCRDRAQRLRLPGIRAPAPGPLQRGGEPFAAASRRSTEELLLGRELGIEIPPPPGPARVLLDGEDLSLVLLRRGWAFRSGPAAGARGRALERAERSARGARAGVWSHQAWVDLRSQSATPLDVALPAATPPLPERSLARHAEKLTDKSWEERKAAFEAALALLEADDP